jgi:hypothetical protein
MDQLLINLLASAIFFTLGVIFRSKLLPWYTRLFNPLRSIMPFGFSPSTIHIAYGLIPPDSQRMIYTIEEGDVRTIHEIEDIFAFIYGQKRVLIRSYIDVDRSQDILNSIVTVSGPKWNNVAERLIGRLGSPATFDKENGVSRLVLKKGTQQIEAYYLTERINPKIARRCYGIILSGKVRRASGELQAVLVCAGNSTLSSYGVVLFLRNCLNNRQLIKQIRRSGIDPKKRWGLVIEVINNTPDTTSAPINPSYMQFKIMRLITEKEFLDPYVYKYPV